MRRANSDYEKIVFFTSSFFFDALSKINHNLENTVVHFWYKFITTVGDTS
jgi:hypothetical protein